MTEASRQFGRLINIKRGTTGIRQAAAECGVSSSALSRIENGKTPDIANFARICRWLDVDPRDYLLSFDEKSR